MRVNRYIQWALASASILLFTTTAWADNFDDALKAAYKTGFQDGYLAGKNGSGGGGGSQGDVIGFVAPKGSGKGGGTSGYEVPWAMQLNEKTNMFELIENTTSKPTTNAIPQALDEKALLGKFKAHNQNTGTVVIENLQLNDINKFGELMKNTQGAKVWVAPSVK